MYTTLSKSIFKNELFSSCDADPEALADYVLALLKHDAAEPDLRKMFVSQLEEFLEEGSIIFLSSRFPLLLILSYRSI